MNTIAIYLIAYIGILLLVTWYLSRKQSKEDFLIAGRDRSGWHILLSSFAAAIGAGYFVTYTGFAYEFGIGVFAMLSGIIIGYLIFSYWALPRITKHAREQNFYTIGHYVYERTRNAVAARTADFLTIVILGAWLLVGIISGAEIISEFELLSYSTAAILISLAALLYLLFAGLKAVIFTDIIQSIIIFVLFIVVTFGVINTGNFVELHTFQPGKLEVGTTIGFFLYGMFSIFSFSNRYQLAYSAKTKSGMKNGMGLSVIPMLLMAYFLLLIGVFMSLEAPGLDSDLVFTEALKQFLQPELVPLAVVLFFAGIMSSADTTMYGIASHIALKGNPQKNDERSITRKKGIRIVLGILTLIVIAIAILFPDVVNVSIVAGAVSVIPSLGMIYLIANGKYVSRFFGAIGGSVIGFIAGLLYFGLVPTVLLPVLALSVIGLVSGRWIVIIFHKMSKKEK